MKILNKKVFREIFKKNKLRSLIIILAIFMTVSFFFGLANSKGAIFASYDENLVKLNSPEARLSFSDFININNVSKLLDNTSVLQQAGIQGIEGRIYVHADVTYKGTTYDAYWIALNSTKDHPNQIDKLRILKGVNYFNPGNVSDALIGYQFAESIFGHNVQLGDKFTIKYNGITLPELTVKGTVQSNEYTYLVDDRSGLPRLGDMVVIYTSLDWAWSNLGPAFNHTINQMMVDTITMSKESANNAVNILSPVLASQGAPIYNYYNSWNTPDRKMFEADAGVLDKFSYVLGTFTLIMGIIIVYNSLTKLISSQRKYIGLMEALGGNKYQILTHYTLIGTYLGIIGVILGIIFSLIITYLLIIVLLAFYGFGYYTITFDPVLFIGGSGITLLAIIIFSILACFPVLNITPREAMVSTITRTGLNKRPIVEKMLRKLKIIRGISIGIPFREIFMHKKRTSLTIIAVAVSSIILVVSGSMIYSMLYSVDVVYQNYDTTDGKVILNDFQNWQTLKTNITNNAPGITTVEPLVSFPVSVTVNNQSKGFALYEAVWKNSTMRHYHIIRGTAPTNALEVLLGQSIATDWKVNINDEITFLVAGQVGNQIISQSYTVTVTGIVGEMLDLNIMSYLDNNVLTILQGNVNGAIFTKQATADFNSIQNYFYSNYHVAQIENTKKSADSIRQLFEVIIELSSVFMVAGILMLMVFIFNTIYLAYLDRELEYLALRAQGARKLTINKIINIEALILGIAGFLVAIPISIGASYWAMDYLLGGKWYVDVVFPLWLWLLLFIISLFSVLLASYLLSRRINKAVMANVLRDRQIG
ncbi:MAG: FtsX-like permease family protein [Candidatus Thorarchaeota archaeon]